MPPPRMRASKVRAPEWDLGLDGAEVPGKRAPGVRARADKPRALLPFQIIARASHLNRRLLSERSSTFLRVGPPPARRALVYGGTTADPLRLGELGSRPDAFSATVKGSWDCTFRTATGRSGGLPLTRSRAPQTMTRNALSSPESGIRLSRLKSWSGTVDSQVLAQARVVGQCRVGPRTGR